MSFAHPLWLAAGLVICTLLALAGVRHDTRQRAELARFIAPQLCADLTRSLSRSRQIAKRCLLLGSFALLFVALAGPQGGFRWEQVRRRGNDILFAVDTSRSMLSPDVKPNRLTRAKLAIDDFVTRLDGDAVGLVAFAGGAFLQTPLTLDYTAFHESLAALDTNIIPRGGTDIASAIAEARSAFRNRPDADRVLILVTDGEDLQGNGLAAAAAAAKADGLKIYTVGVGTPAGELIPLPVEQGGGFIKDATGNPVKSSLDEPALRAIAAATGGLYAPLGAAGQGLDSIYQKALVPLAKHDLSARQQRIYTQLYQWPVVGALALLLASVLLGTRRHSPRVRRPAAVHRPMARPVAVGATALALTLLAVPYVARASTRSAAQAYAKGDYAAATRDYAAMAARQPQQPLLQYDLGTAAYRAGQYAAARTAFETSLKVGQSTDQQRLGEQESAYYNLGNTQYRSGQKALAGSPQQAIEDWTQAVRSYETALQLRPGDADSRFNRDFVRRKLDELKKKQSQQEQSSQSKPQQNSQKDQKSQSAGTGQGNGQAPPQPGHQPQDAKQGNGRDLAQQQPQSQPASPMPASGSQSEANKQARPQPGQRPQPTRQAGNPPSQGAAQTADEDVARRVPGQMSPEEARQLLDSVKADTQRYPVAPLARSGNVPLAADPPARDW